MNRILYIICTMFLIILTSCSTISEYKGSGKGDITNGKYRDGIYTEEGEIWKYGNENATVVISNGKIVKITLRKLDNTGKEVEYDEWGSESTNGKGKPNLKQYRIDIAKRMLEKQSYDVEAISGATISSENWKRAVKKALIKASK